MSKKQDKICAAICLPTVATYNLRSMLPKIGNLTTDILEREIDCAFLQEIWENEDNANHQFEIEKLLEIHGLQYMSTSRKPNSKGVAYGGAAILVNLEKFQCEKIPVQIPQSLEVVWALLRPKNVSAKFKEIIVCSFYSPPNKRQNSKMADHVVGTLHMLATRYPDSGIILGADKNEMDISPILNCGLRLRNCVDQPTRQGVVLDVILMNTFAYFNSAIIVPPIQPDDPVKGKPSDHSVPVCVPHTDRYNRPRRSYKTIKYRPLPESSLRKLGEWIVTEEWGDIKGDLSPTQQVKAFETLILNKLDHFCPEKTVKLSSHDKVWVNGDIKRLARLKSREYNRHGKSAKYKDLAKKFKAKYEAEARKYLQKNISELMQCKPGQAYNVLKKMGAKPGECIDSNTFTLPTHESENLSAAQSAERIADYFAQISQEFPPLDYNLLPPRVQSKLDSHSVPPTIDEHETYQKIKSAKKPKSCVPGDIPRPVILEFSPELASPVCSIIQNIVQSCEWPTQWTH